MGSPLAGRGDLGCAKIRLSRPSTTSVGLHRLDEGEAFTYQLPYGEWIRLLGSNGFVVEELIEPRPVPDAVSTYWDKSERDWARRWPSESIWKASKAG